MSIPKETIDTIRERARIEEIIARYIPTLKKKGQNYTGLCPFHKEKTPSFIVSPEKQIFHCFGCHEGGNVFTFISKIERINFPESVKLVGSIVGIDVIDKKNDKKNNHLNDLNRINTYAMKVYQAFLKSYDGERALEYLLERGINEKSIDTFQLGYAPESWNFITNKLKSKNANLEHASNIGLISNKDKNGGKHYFDRFRDRVIFPIINQYNTVCGFGGRVIDKNEPKYLNSPDSEIYKKRQILYGFNIAKTEIIELKRVIIVEGYLDVIGCHQEGIQNVVAPLGTALTEEQVTLLSRYAEEIILLFDADNAGIKASLRSIEILDNINIKVRIANLPEDDPFDYIQKKGVREFMAIVESAVNPIDFRINQIMNSSNNLEKLQKLKMIFEIIKTIDFESEQDEYLKKLSSSMNIDYISLKNDFNKHAKNKNNKPIEVTNKNEVQTKKDFKYKSYKDLIILLCNYPELIEKAMVDFTESEMNNSVLKNIFSNLIKEYGDDENFKVDKLFNIFTDGEEKNFLERNLIKNFNIDSPGTAYTEIYLNIKLFDIDQKLEYFAKQIKVEKNSENITEYLTEIEVCKREKEKLSSYLYNLHDNKKNEKKIASF